LFVGMVLAMQGYNMLNKFDADQLIGEMIGLTLTRELGPVISALLFAGRVGSAITAEISLMRITQQLSSIEMMGIDPVKKIIAPRFWAGLISMILFFASTETNQVKKEQLVFLILLFLDIRT